MIGVKYILGRGREFSIRVFVRHTLYVHSKDKAGRILCT